MLPFALKVALEKHNRIGLNAKNLTPQESFNGVLFSPHAPDHRTWDPLPPTRDDPQPPVARPISHDFPDLTHTGLRCSIHKHSPIKRLTYGCLVMIMISLSSVPPVATSCYHVVRFSYDDFLEQNFDGTSNLFNPIAQIFQATIISNEVYSMKAMLRQSDKLAFEKDMHFEVQSLYDMGV